MHKSAPSAVPEQHFPLKLSHMDKPQEVLRARTSRKQSACQMRLLNDVWLAPINFCQNPERPAAIQTDCLHIKQKHLKETSFRDARRKK